MCVGKRPLQIIQTRKLNFLPILGTAVTSILVLQLTALLAPSHTEVMKCTYFRGNYAEKHNTLISALWARSGAGAACYFNN